jgi:hypothetical protein
MSFDDTLTQKEKDAETFLEWSDETLGRCVRHTAGLIKDSKGQNGLYIVAALNVLAEAMRQSNAETATFQTKGDRSGEDFELVVKCKLTRAAMKAELPAARRKG